VPLARDSSPNLYRTAATSLGLWRYIRAADALCEKHFDAKAGHLLSRHLLQRRQLYAHTLGAGDFSTALRVLKSEARLEGIDQRDLATVTSHAQV